MGDSQDTASTARVRVILFCSDLMLTSSVSGTASALGFQFTVVSEVRQLQAALQEAAGDSARVCLFIDLAAPAADLSHLVSVIPHEILCNAVAYGPHVHEARLEAARQAGFGQVMSRGAFHARFSQLLQEWAASCSQVTDRT